MTDMPSTSEPVMPRRRALFDTSDTRVILDALGLPGSVVPLSGRNEMPCVTSDAILEAEMVAFSDSTERIDGRLHHSFSRLLYAKLLLRVLENSESRREDRGRPKAQSPQGA